MKLSLAPLLVALAACSSSGGGGTSTDPAKETSSTSPTPSATTTATSAVPPAAPGGVGAACGADRDCTSGLTCLAAIPAVPAAGFPGVTFPGGYCTHKCGQPTDQEPDLSPDCGAGATCKEQQQSTGQGGRIQIQICAKTCTGNDECRAGYACKADVFGVRTCTPS